MARRHFENYWGSYKIISGTRKRLLETQIFEKKAVFPVKKRFWPTFSCSSECDKPQVANCKGAKGIPAVFVEGIRLFFWDLKGR